MIKKIIYIIILLSISVVYGANYNTTLLYSSFEGTINESAQNFTVEINWGDPDFPTSNGAWTNRTDQALIGLYSAKLGNNIITNGNMNITSYPVNTSNCSKIYIIFQHRDDDIDVIGDDVRIKLKNITGGYDRGTALGSSTEDVWINRTIISNDTVFKHDTFQIKIGNAGNLSNDENFWVDNVSIICEQEPPINTCTYSGSGNWLVNCADNCTFNTQTNLLNNNITFYNSGNVYINTTINGWKRTTWNTGCRLNFMSLSRLG